MVGHAAGVTKLILENDTQGYLMSPRDKFGLIFLVSKPQKLILGGHRVRQLEAGS